MEPFDWSAVWAPGRAARNKTGEPIMNNEWKMTSMATEETRNLKLQLTKPKRNELELENRRGTVS